MENLFQYIWQHRLWGGPGACLTDGRRLTVLSPGILNKDAGPDFFNAKVIIDNTEWAGNIELHLRASDWHRHRHSESGAYDNCILHVVAVDDAVINRPDGTPLPQLHLPFSKEALASYEILVSRSNDIRCAHYLKHLTHMQRTEWLESLACERLQTKARRFTDMASHLRGDWQQVCFAMFARALGFGLNADPFEQLGRSIPLTVLAHHSDDLMQLQAIVFGQAGLLDSSVNIFDDYYQQLCREYAFLARKYSLHPMPRSVWKFSRTRPANFPHRRMALLALLARGGFSLLQRVIERHQAPHEITALFNVELPSYWATHYSFTTPTARSSTRLSQSSLNLLLINFAAPLLYAYGNHIGDTPVEEAAFDLLNGLPPESNRIIRPWTTAGIEPESALQSQALIQLNNEYCQPHECLRCRWGHRLMRDAVSLTSPFAQN